MAPKVLDRKSEKWLDDLIATPGEKAGYRIGYQRAVARRPERKKMEKQFEELLGLVSKEDRSKALKLMWEIFYHAGMRPIPLELLWVLGIIEKEMKKLGIPIYLT